MATHAFVDSVIKEIIQPGVDQLMESRYFSELRQGKLSKRRLQGWAIQHYIHKLESEKFCSRNQVDTKFDFLI